MAFTTYQFTGTSTLTEVGGVCVRGEGQLGVLILKTSRFEKNVDGQIGMSPDRSRNVPSIETPQR